MASTPKNLIPTPGRVQILDGTIVRISEIGRLPRFHRPDGTLHPRRFVLTWELPNGAAGDWVRRHHDDYPHDVFEFQLPRTGETVFAVWAGPPNIQWASSTTAATITAEVEEVLAHE